jgi:hypothetical protein
MKTWTIAACVLAIVAACSDKKRVPVGNTPPTGSGGSCAIEPGQFPPSTCDPSANQCTGTKQCPIDENKCGSTSTCMPMAKNDGKQVIDFRIRRLNVASPQALAVSVVQKSIVDKGITLAAKECGELGDGAFNWIIRFDKTTGVVKTGGAPPSSDPFNVGYCFVNTTIQGLKIEPIEAKLTVKGNNYSIDTPIEKLNVPIFVGGKVDKPVILPLSKVFVKDVTVSDNDNCIGSFNYAALDNLCLDPRDDCSRWLTAGSLGGFITLEESDGVILADLGGKSLCLQLTGGPPDDANPLKCKREGGKVVAKGDFCSTTNSPGGCQDSYWLAATFAASAVKIHDGASARSSRLTREATRPPTHPRIRRPNSVPTVR